MGCLEFIMSDSEMRIATTRTWRHLMACKLIESGVNDPDQIIKTIEALHSFIIGPTKPLQNDLAQDENKKQVHDQNKIIDTGILKSLQNVAGQLNVENL